MERLRRRMGLVTVALLSCCVSLTGCMSTAFDAPVMNGPGGMAQQGVPNMPAPAMTNRPGMPMPNGPQSGVQQASFAQPQAQFTGQVAPAPAGEYVMEQPGGVMMQGQGFNPPMPRELVMTTHAPHRVAAPDILYIEALRMVPKGPYHLEAMEVLQIEVSDTLPKQDIKGLFMISPEGAINLGFSYGSVRIGGMTVEQAQAAIRGHLGNILKTPTVNIALVQMRGMQNIKGEHLVRPDGTVSLGMYGSVFVAGMTVGQVKASVESYLSAYLVNPQVSVDVLAYNSRKIYIIADGAGYGQQVIALPATGNETVLDAISRVQGLPPVSSLHKIWISRPSPAGTPCSTVLPVDWKAITQAGRTETNYQLLPGDRIYIASNPLICAYNYIDMALAPFERCLGVLFLGTSTWQSFRTNNSTGVIVR